MTRGALSVLCVLGVGACHGDKTQSVVEPRSDAEDATDSAEPIPSGGDTWDPLPVGWEMEWLAPSPDSPIDECAETCFSVELRFEEAPVAGLTVVLEQEQHGFLGEAVTGNDGVATLCVTGLLVGVRSVAATARVDGKTLLRLQQMEVRPFGYDIGLPKPVDPLVSVSDVPAFERHPDNPVIGQGEEGEWDRWGAIMASVVKTDAGYFMYYAGTASGDYSIGVATSDDGLTWTRYAENPIYGPGGDEHPWRQYATNGPSALVVDGVFKLWFSGRKGETGEIGIGLAESDDGLTFTELESNPVFEADPANADWEGEAVAHPSVTYRDGIYEMWYSTGLHRIGYAISTDGTEWTRYCGGPVLRGDGADWENGMVKAAEVAVVDGLYLMTFTGGEPGAFRLGWAVSNDGIRWVTSGTPVLSEIVESDWENQSVLAATWRLEDGVLTAWYSGTSSTASGVGVATAAWGAR